MCNITHHKYLFDSSLASIGVLETLAAVSEKYECSLALSQRTALRPGPLSRKLEDVSNIGQPLLPSIHLDDPAVFQKITRLMVYTSYEPYVSPSSRHNPSGASSASQVLLPEELLCTLALLPYASARTAFLRD